MFDALPPARRALAVKAHQKLHELWTKSDGPAYVKSEWQALEAALEALAFATPVHDSTCTRCRGRILGAGYPCICIAPAKGGLC